jgi:hypothetical protein
MITPRLRWVDEVYCVATAIPERLELESRVLKIDAPVASEGSAGETAKDSDKTEGTGSDDKKDGKKQPPFTPMGMTLSVSEFVKMNNATFISVWSQCLSGVKIIGSPIGIFGHTLSVVHRNQTNLMLRGVRPRESLFVSQARNVLLVFSGVLYRQRRILIRDK